MIADPEHHRSIAIQRQIIAVLKDGYEGNLVPRYRDPATGERIHRWDFFNRHALALTVEHDVLRRSNP